MYDEGRGTPQDIAEAVRSYRRAAKRGNADAISAIGNLYANGKGVDEDIREANAWYCKEAKLGHRKSLDMTEGSTIEVECRPSDDAGSRDHETAPADSLVP